PIQTDLMSSELTVFDVQHGLIEAIDLRTGRTVWSATAGDADIPWSDRFVHDLSVAGGHLIVPTGYELSVYEPLPVSIRGPTRALRGSQVTLVTHSAPGSRVEIYRKESGATAFSLLAVRQADSTGRAAASFSIRRDTDYYALSDGVQSPIRHTKAIRDVAIPAGMPNTRAGNYQINPTHTGAQSQEVLRPPLRRAWARAFPGRVSYPVVFGGRAFVVAEAAQGEPTDNPRTLLYALEAATGELLWGPIKLDSQARFAAVASDGDRLYLLNQRLLGDTLSALDPATGNELWSVGLGGGFPPTAVDGAVYLAGGTAIDGVTGDPVASATGGGWRTRGPPAVSRSRVFSSMSCPAAQAYSTDGQFLWQSQELTGECDQWSFTTAVHDGRVYVRSRLSDDAVYRASDGHLLRRFSSEPIPAFAGQVGYRVVNGRLIALMSRQA
ncbi:MAG: PQQ-binding-like beta-propeller repeat protein, partial [Chloroflexota bacterium]